MSIIFCEIVAVYGLIVGIIFLNQMDSISNSDFYSGDELYTGFAIFWSGTIVGMCNLICGLAVGINGSGAALADAAEPTM